MPARKIKIGIDVGGTFTHAVAVDAGSIRLVGKAMVPTTHRAKEGVARGVVESLTLLLKRARIRPSEVALIAHSTTQATNALLEGDVAPVGIVGMGKGVEGWRAKHQTNITDIELAPGKFLKTFHRYIDVSNGLDDRQVRDALEGLKGEGARVIVASEAFGVDHPEHERRVADLARSLGFPATASSDISQLYGLRVRTRTAIINASMLPKMLETAEMTDRSVRKSGIKAPLMIMRSDGGIMDIAEMRRRPILTMLSGPAAGVTAALMFVRISDGLFLEVGGTSTDISIIKNGRPMVRSAEVGGHRLYVRTLDIRTVGIAGGSMPRLKGTTVIDVGPRSAHIAGLRYCSFAQDEEVRDPRLQLVRPQEGDPDDYLALATSGSPSPNFAFTTTEAANVLGLATRYARANDQALRPVSQWLATELGTSEQDLAHAVLKISSAKIEDVVRQFVQEYKLDPSLLTLVGGGGGAEAVVPYAAGQLKMEHWIAEHAEVISAIGVALGMIRDTVERSVVAPTDTDILRIRKEAMESVVRMGAAPDSVEVRVEVDTRQKRLIATATGSPEMRVRKAGARRLSSAELNEAARKSFKQSDGEVRLAGETEFMKIFQISTEHRRLFGLVREQRSPVRVLDAEGVTRLKLADGRIMSGTVSSVSSSLGPLIDEHTVYGDAGALLPDVFVIVGSRIYDLSGLVSKDQILSLLRAETERSAPDDDAIAVVAKQ